MDNYNQLLFTIKTITKDTIKAMKPAKVCFGTVTSASPLKVQIDQKLTIGVENLVIPQHLTNYDLQINVTWNTESAIEHSHAINGNKTIRVNNALNLGDKVAMIRQAGGQQFLIIDRVV